MSETDDLKELVQKAVAGDRAAFEELYRATCSSVYFTCFGLLKDEQEAKDVTQDVYLTVFEQLSTLEDVGRFTPWLYRIAANKSINRLKKKQPMLPGDEQLEDKEPEDNENFLPEEYALNADKREMVLKIVRETCSDVLYQTILLHYFNELSIAEIAEIMECPEGTVKYRLSAARAKIKEGVLQYEKKSGDKLYSFASIPFLTALFTAQMQDMQIPSFPLSFLGALPKSTLAASAAKKGGRIVLKSLQLKIAAGAATALLALGGVAAAAIITHQNAEETSAGGQEESGLNVADSGNTENMETPPESVTQLTEAEESQATGQSGSETIEELESGEGSEPEESTTEEEAEESAEPETTEESETTEDTETAEEAATEESEADEETESEEAASEAEAAEETPEPTAEPASESTTEPTPETTYTYTDMSAIMYAQQTVNVRDLPGTDGEKVGSLSTNQEVAVSGQCNETGWYRIDYNGQTAYVSNNYLSDSKVEVPEQSASSDGGNSNSTGAEPFPYPLNVWTAETTEYGLTIYVVYTTKNDLTDILWYEPVPENNYMFTDKDADGKTAFNRAMNEQTINLYHSSGIRYGYHYVYPIVKVGTYAEGTVYKCSAGVHYSSADGGCPNFGTGICQPGTVD